jgi:hypothetical protein
MKKRTFFIYIAYVWTKTILGLTFHPYLSVRETVRRPILLPVVISPILGLGLLLIASKIGSVLIIVYGAQREIIALFLSTTFISIVLWQLLLLYLLFSFIFARLKRGMKAA